MSEFILEVPIDASSVEDRERGEPVRVTAVAANGVLVSDVVKLPANGKSTVKLRFDERPKNLRVHVGPGAVAAEELPKLQAIEIPVAADRFQNTNRLKLDSLTIKPNVWKLWRGWCQTFKVSGHVRCFDGRPVIGAEVTAFDIDWCWWWTSKQSVASAITNEDGYYEMSFTWCCGYWPWWWWNRRHWRLEPGLIDRIKPILRLHPDLPEPPRPTPTPDLGVFERILADAENPPRLPDLEGLRIDNVIERRRRLDTGVLLNRRLDVEAASADLGSALAFDPARLARLREPLIERLPAVEELGRLRVWPWYPWCGWADCAPDLVMRVTQTCGDEEDKVILDQGFLQTRWNIDRDETIDLFAFEACCRDDTPQPEGDCLNLTHVCGKPISQIAGNPRSVPAPAGYFAPGTQDKPFGGAVTLSGDFGTGARADYYEIEWLDPSAPGATWQALPAGAMTGFKRLYFGPALPGGPTDTHVATFPVREIDGRRVIESRQHFESQNQPGTWEVVAAGSRWWTHNKTTLGNWLTDGFFADGTYKLRIKSWELTAPDTLGNPEILGLCGGDEPLPANEVSVRVDNRIITDPLAHGDPCGSGTVHICTDEPETRFLDARIRRADGTTRSTLAACSEVEIAPTDRLWIRFRASDPDGHLSHYHLQITYGENQKRVLIANGPQLGATLTQVGGGTDVGPTYGQYLAQVPGASPVWSGGDYEIEVDAAAVFPTTCAYQLELRAYKRTIVNCNDQNPHRNLSERSFLVRVGS